MAKKRVFELAKELGLSNKDLVSKAHNMGLDVKSHMSVLDDFQIDRIKRELNLGGSNTIVEKRVTSTVIRRRVRKEGEEPTKPPEPPEESKEEAEEEKKEKKARKEEPEKKLKIVGKPKEPVRRLKIVEKKPEPQRPVKEKEQEKPKKAPLEKILGEFTVEKEKKPEKPLYQRLKVVPKKAVDEATDLKKAISKEDKIRRLRERFKPEVDHAEEDFFPLKTFEKIKSRKKREIIDIKDIKTGKFHKRKKIVKKGLKTEITTPKAIKRIIKIDRVIQVGDLAKRMSVKASELMAKLLALGSLVTITQSVDADTAAIVAADFGFTVEQAKREDAAHILDSMTKGGGELKRRFPVVTVMGHVDHGKTTLLDQIRKTSVAQSEVGGITQRIGAYAVDIKNSKIVFIDTPGHEAFTSMRARGAQVTDIVVLVVAADDGVMPQTIEAINHAKEAKVPIIVAINKIDKPGVNPERIKQELTEHGLVSEEWGGENIFVSISAKTGKGIPELLDMILLQAEVLDLKADPEKLMTGIVIESRLDKGKGPLATLIVKEGTLKIGSPVVIGESFGKVRAMSDEKGKSIKEAGPSMPVEIQGLSSVPEAGEICYVVDDERLAKQVSELVQKKSKEPSSEKAKISLEDLYAQIQKGGLKELKLVIKADTVGSVEALKNSLLKLSNDRVVVKCIHENVGNVTEGDIMLASASNAVIIGFNIRMDTGVGILAEREKVGVRFYNIIYEAIDEVKKSIEGLLEPKLVEKTLGRAEVKEVFNISKLGPIAGSLVLDGKIQRNLKARLLRNNAVVYDGKISSLKRFKDDVRDVQVGMECGIGIDSYGDIKVGDIIECYDVEKVKSTLF